MPAEGGVRILPLADLPAAQDAAYLLAEEGSQECPYFIVGEFCTTGNHLGLDQEGAVWFLDHEYGPEEWSAGEGAFLAGSSLKEFALRLARERGRWWFLPGN